MPYNCRTAVALSHAAVLCPSDVAKAAEEEQKKTEASDKDGDVSTVEGAENDGRFYWTTKVDPRASKV